MSGRLSIGFANKMSDPNPISFHEALWAGLDGDNAVLAPWWPDPDHGLTGLSVYRNTVYKGLADALAASFPSVLAVVGTDWMREASLLFAREHLPKRAILVDYGGAFPDWLSKFKPAVDMPYLADLARLDRLWTEAHLAADDSSLAIDFGASPLIQSFEALGLRLIASARLAWFGHSIPDLWQALRGPETFSELELEAVWQAVLIWRPGHEVQIKRLTPKAHAFLTACQAGKSFAVAATETSYIDDPEDLSLVFADLISCGVFAALTPIETNGNSR
jgi:hypothetical protein